MELRKFPSDDSANPFNFLNRVLVWLCAVGTSDAKLYIFMSLPNVLISMIPHTVRYQFPLSWDYIWSLQIFLGCTFNSRVDFDFDFAKWKMIVWKQILQAINHLSQLKCHWQSDIISSMKETRSSWTTYMFCVQSFKNFSKPVSTFIAQPDIPRPQFLCCLLLGFILPMYSRRPLWWSSR